MVSIYPYVGETRGFKLFQNDNFFYLNHYKMHGRYIKIHIKGENKAKKKKIKGYDNP